MYKKTGSGLVEVVFVLSVAEPNPPRVPEPKAPIQVASPPV